jgi:hypothetical protein
VPSSQGLEVGADVQGCCGFFSGDLADIAVFPAALTAAQVTAQYVAAGVTAGLRPGASGGRARRPRTPTPQRLTVSRRVTGGRS